MLHHHDRQVIRAVADDRRRSAARPTAEARELEYTVLAAASSSGAAWAALVERFGARVRGVARRHGLGAHDADDVAQATWLALFEHIGELREPAAIGGWLETTARRESLRLISRGRTERAADGELLEREPVEPVNERRLVASERRYALRAGLRELPEHQYALLALLFSDPAPVYTEISRSLRMPRGSIGPTRRRGLDRLRQDERLAELCER
jgi:RNA polymerase sigma factor (sigma-70 family)